MKIPSRSVQLCLPNLSCSCEQVGILQSQAESTDWQLQEVPVDSSSERDETLIVDLPVADSSLGDPEPATNL